MTGRRRTSLAIMLVMGVSAIVAAGCAGAKPRIEGKGLPLPPGASPVAAPPSTIVADRMAGQVPWMRAYLDPARLPDAQQKALAANCASDPETGLLANPSFGPTIAVLGDSAIGVARGNALADGLYHWVFASACDETFASAVDTGRLDRALGTSPDVLAIVLGGNDVASVADGKPQTAHGDEAVRDLNRLLDASDKVKCRVILTLPEVTRPELGDAGGHADNADEGKARIAVAKKVNAALAGAASRPGVHVVDFNARVQTAPRYFVWDHMHPTNAGVNLMINSIVEGAQPCLSAPPAPTNVEAIADATGTHVVWNPVPGPSITYVVERSDGHVTTAHTTQALLPENALADANGDPLRFRVSAMSGVTASPWSQWAEVEDALVVQPVWSRLLVVVLMAGLVVGVVLVIVARSKNGSDHSSEDADKVAELV